MVYVTRLIGREAQYVPYIVAANWCSAIPIALFGVLAILGASGAVGPGIADFLALVALLWALSFQWFVARTVLAVGGLAAAGVIVLDLIIGIMITGPAQALTTQAKERKSVDGGKSYSVRSELGGRRSNKKKQ